MTIYLKKTDGSIEQFEDSLRQALNIDKEIQGESFGIIYDAESLPDEDKLKLGLITAKEVFDKQKEAKISEIKAAFGNEFVSGHFLSEALQIEVDYRRCGSEYGDDKNDLQNAEKLLNFMKRKNLTSVTYKGYETQKASATQEQMQLLIDEMVDHSIFLHEKKDTLLAQIKTASFEQLENIKW